MLNGGFSKNLPVYQNQKACFRLGGPTMHSKETISTILEWSPPMCFLHNRNLHF